MFNETRLACIAQGRSRCECLLLFQWVSEGNTLLLGAHLPPAGRGSIGLRFWRYILLPYLASRGRAELILIIVRVDITQAIKSDRLHFALLNQSLPLFLRVHAFEGYFCHTHHLHPLTRTQFLPYLAQRSQSQLVFLVETALSAAEK